MRPELVRTSRFLSLVLRHDPGRIGLALDGAGWARVDDLLARAAQAGTPVTPAELRETVETNDKRRFALSADGARIRASQGHSVAVDLGLAPQRPPDRLFHGTARRHLASIQAAGLVPGRRQHVHLSADEATAVAVGARHGAPVVLSVDAGAMHGQGFPFYRSANGVWLTAAVPPTFVTVSDA